MINRTTENILYYCVILRNKTRFYTHLSSERGVFSPREHYCISTLLFHSHRRLYPVHPRHANAALAAIAIIPTHHPMAQLASKYNIYTVFILPDFPTLGTTARKNLPSSSNIILFSFRFLLDCFNIMTYPPNYTELRDTCSRRIIPIGVLDPCNSYRTTVKKKKCMFTSDD